MGGETALAAAAGAGQAEAVRWLLRRGADAGLCDDRHASPLDKARRGGHAACAQATPVALSVMDAINTCGWCSLMPPHFCNCFKYAEQGSGRAVCSSECIWCMLSNTECMNRSAGTCRLCKQRGELRHGEEAQNRGGPHGACQKGSDPTVRLQPSLAHTHADFQSLAGETSSSRRYHSASVAISVRCWTEKYHVKQ